MQYSAIVVVARPDAFDECRAQVAAVADVSVQELDPSTGRLIAVAETEDDADPRGALRRLQALPAVAVAELVVHYLDDEPRDPPSNGSTRVEEVTPVGGETP